MPPCDYDAASELSLLLLETTNMRRSRFSPEQIVKALKIVEDGKSVRELSLEIGVSEATFYSWKKAYSGLPAAGIDNARALARENARLRHTVYLQQIEIDVLRTQLKGSGGAISVAPIRASE